MEKLINNIIEMLDSCYEKTNNLVLNILKNNKELSSIIYYKLFGHTKFCIDEYQAIQAHMKGRHSAKVFYKIIYEN